MNQESTKRTIYSYAQRRSSRPAGVNIKHVSCLSISDPEGKRGSDAEKRARALESGEAGLILDRARGLLDEGYDVAFYCALGRHRSYALAEELHRVYPQATTVRHL
jgi:hypothetical protein